MNKLGFSYTEIAKLLTDKGYRTKRGGKKFYYSTVEYIVKSKNTINLFQSQKKV